MHNNNDTQTRPVLPTGTEVHYYVLCQRKLWWFAYGIEQEHVEGNQGAENVALGQLLHQGSFPAADGRCKEAMIDGKLRIDFTEDGLVHEIKKSRGGDHATKTQVLYYLWYLKHEKGIVTSGVIHYPKEKRTVPVLLTAAAEREVEGVIDGISEVKGQEAPPAMDAPMSICTKCSYQDLCWG